jgi:hypothetical protein
MDGRSLRMLELSRGDVPFTPDTVENLSKMPFTNGRAVLSVNRRARSEGTAGHTRDMSIRPVAFEDRAVLP